MSEFINFIITNKRLILEVVILIISVIVFILRKPSRKTLLDSSASSSLIDLVLDAEKKFGPGHGREKLEYVLNTYCSHLVCKEEDIKWIKEVLTIAVEKILSTPQKKK